MGSRAGDPKSTGARLPTNQSTSAKESAAGRRIKKLVGKSSWFKENRDGPTGEETANHGPQQVEDEVKQVGAGQFRSGGKAKQQQPQQQTSTNCTIR